MLNRMLHKPLPRQFTWWAIALCTILWITCAVLESEVSIYFSLVTAPAMLCSLGMQSQRFFVNALRAYRRDVIERIPRLEDELADLGINPARQLEKQQAAEAEHRRPKALRRAAEALSILESESGQYHTESTSGSRGIPSHSFLQPASCPHYHRKDFFALSGVYAGTVCLDCREEVKPAGFPYPSDPGFQNIR